MGQEKKRDIYDKITKFKNRRKNCYHWDHEDNLDGLLEQPRPHETDPIPTEFKGVEFDADEADGTSTDQ